MKTIIIDDEADARIYLKSLLSLYDEIELLGEAENVEKGKKLIKATSPELIFLDVEMPDGTGIDLLQSLSNQNFQVIFCTAHDKYALQALRLSALDYLLKPIDPDDLDEAIEKAKATQQIDNRQINTLLNNFKDNQQPQKLILKDKSNFYIVEIPTIIRCQGEGSYTTFVLDDGESITVSKNLRTYEKILDYPYFFRVHNSHLINLNHVKRISRQDGGYVILTDLSEIPISKSRKEALFVALF